MSIGIPSVEFSVPAGTAAGIGRFYESVIGAPAIVSPSQCDVAAGPSQILRFVEVGDSDQPIADYDGHHLAVYVADFSGPHAWLLDHGLVEEESNAHQYRFNWIADPESGERLFEIEHEVRSVTHPLFGRPLVNRNLEQRTRGYVRGADAARAV